MKFTTSKPHGGFTLIETVIAIGVLAVLLTAFMLVFGPAAEGIKKSINIQTADRMATTLENELSNLRNGEATTGVGAVLTGFDKAFKFIEASMIATPPPATYVQPQVLFVYQYRGDLKAALRSDGTMTPYKGKGKAGEDYTVVTMAHRRITITGGVDANFKADLEALEGYLFAVKLQQLVFNTGQLVENPTNKIANPTNGLALTAPTAPNSGASDNYPEAVIAFSASFYALPSSSYDYVKPGLGAKFDFRKLKGPIFTRNLAVRR